MTNEIILLSHAIIVSLCALGALRMGKEALITFISVQGILANVFVVKQTVLFGYTVTCSDAFTIGAVLGLNLLQEYFGRDATKQAIWISFGALVFYGVMTQIHLTYAPALVDTMHGHYDAILGFMPRIVIASFMVYLITQLIDAWLYAKVKTLVNGRFLLIRNYFSMTVSQFIDTVLFSFLGLYGIVDNIWHIIFMSYAIKLVTIAIASPFITFSKKAMK